MSKLYPLKGKIQHYAWGGQTYIPNLFNDETQDQPCAEYWMGAHDKAPSMISTAEGETPLNEFVQSDTRSILGETISKKFGRLPFLFKVLDVKDMLSIQVHPTKSEAEKGFARENELGTPLDAPHRNYKDDNHKPEIMVALSDFWLLHGFLPEADLREVLTETKELSHLIEIFDKGGYFELYKHVMEQSDEECLRTLKPLLERIIPLYRSEKLEKSSPDYWAAKAAEAFSTEVPDRGIYSIYFFNIVRVAPGQAVFQDAGIPHAYLEGQNMELMANSDNVLRGGLTPKHVDVPELLKHVVFEEAHPNVMSGELQPDGLEKVFKSPAPDFQLSKIELKASDYYQSLSRTAEILITLEGEILIEEGDKKLMLRKGNAAFLSAGSDYKIETSGSATIYKATAP